MGIGDKVEHVLSKDWLLVLDIVQTDSGLIFKCRTKDLDIVELFEFELKPVR